MVALCDTNGGMLPDQVGDVVDTVLTARLRGHHRTRRHPLPQRCRLRRRQHSRRRRRRRHPRPGNAERLRRTHRERRPRHHRRQPAAQARAAALVPDAALREATRIAHAVSEVTNIPPYSRQPYVGASAFTHKAGLHASAIKVDPNLYQHAEPEDVGNDMRLLVSDMAGRASIELKGRELGYELDRRPCGRHPDHRTGEGDGGPRLHVRGGRRLVRTAPHRGGRRRTSGVLRGRVLAGDHRLAPRRGGRLRGDGQAACGRRAGDRHRRGQRTGQRARLRPARRDRAGVPRSSTSST